VQTQTGGYAFSFAAEADFIAATPFLAADGTPSAGVEATGPFPIADGRAWLTADGVVALNRSDVNALVRYSYAGSAPLDEFVIAGDTEGYEILSFDAGGSWWFLYDRFAGTLQKLRTWW